MGDISLNMLLNELQWLSLLERTDVELHADRRNQITNVVTRHVTGFTVIRVT